MPQINASCGMCVTEEETTYTGLRDMMEIVSGFL